MKCFAFDELAFSDEKQNKQTKNLSIWKLPLSFVGSHCQEESPAGTMSQGSQWGFGAGPLWVDVHGVPGTCCAPIQWWWPRSPWGGALATCLPQAVQHTPDPCSKPTRDLTGSYFQVLLPPSAGQCRLPIQEREGSYHLAAVMLLRQTTVYV